MNDKKIKHAQNRNIYLLNTAKLIATEIANNKDYITQIATKVGITEEKLLNSLNDPTKNQNVIVAAKGHIRTKSK